MYESDDIVGLTFSEFAFFVAFVLILLLVVGAQRSVQLKAQLAEMAGAQDRDRVRVAELEKELAKRPAVPDLRSRQRPSCIEKKVVPGFLFRATIVGPDLYIVDGSGTPVT